jgi:hypothetical protein
MVNFEFLVLSKRGELKNGSRTACLAAAPHPFRTAARERSPTRNCSAVIDSRYSGSASWRLSGKIRERQLEILNLPKAGQSFASLCKALPPGGGGHRSAMSLPVSAPFKVAQGHSRLLKPIKPYSRGCRKKNCLFYGSRQS